MATEISDPNLRGIVIPKKISLTPYQRHLSYQRLCINFHIFQVAHTPKLLHYITSSKQINYKEEQLRWWVTGWAELWNGVGCTKSV